MPQLGKEAQNVYSEGDNILTGDMTLRIARTRMESKQTLNVVGLGEALTGLYYIESVTHNFSRSTGYTQSISVSKDGFGISIQKPPKPKPKPKKPNPTARTHKIKKGDTLWWISDRYYGDPLKWKKIARANNIKWSKREEYYLKIGRVIKIP